MKNKTRIERRTTEKTQQRNDEKSAIWKRLWLCGMQLQNCWCTFDSDHKLIIFSTSESERGEERSAVVDRHRNAFRATFFCFFFFTTLWRQQFFFVSSFACIWLATFKRWNVLRAESALCVLFSLCFWRFFPVFSFLFSFSVSSALSAFAVTLCRLESATMVAKSDLAATRLRYEQQVYNMQTELNAQQVSFDAKSEQNYSLNFFIWFLFVSLSLVSIRNNANASNAIAIHSSSCSKAPRKQSKNWKRTVAAEQAKDRHTAATKTIVHVSSFSNKR